MNPASQNVKGAARRPGSTGSQARIQQGNRIQQGRPGAVRPNQAANQKQGRGSQRTAARKSVSDKRSFKAIFKDIYFTYIKVTLPVTIVIALLIIGGIVDLSVSFGKIHPGVKVEGVNVGGMTIEEAAEVLEENLTPMIEDTSLTIYSDVEHAAADGVQIEVDDDGVPKAYADEVGLDKDGDGVKDKWNLTSSTLGAYIDGMTVAQEAYQVGRRGHVIFDRMKSWIGLSNLDGIVSFNNDVLSSLINEINDQLGWATVESNISVSEGVASASEGHDGWLLNEEDFSRYLSYALFNQDENCFVAPMETKQMHIYLPTAQAVADQVNAAIASEVLVTYQGNSWSMDSTTLGGLISTAVLEPDQVLNIGWGTEVVESPIAEGEEGYEDQEPLVAEYDVSKGTDNETGWILQAYVKQEAADTYLVSILGEEALGGATDAYFETDGDTIHIVDSQTGTGPDRQAAAKLMQNILFGSEPSRLVALVDTTIQPRISTEDLQAMGVTEKLASWSIPLTGTESRIHNLTLMCQLINGSLVAPGQEWSLNETTGPRDAEAGFEAAPVYVDGRHEDLTGGGACQVATCVYNAACFSGVTIRNRVNHSTYIKNYDEEGFADATVADPSPDFVWQNDYDTYIYITADTSSGSVVVTFWGTKDGRVVTCDRGDWEMRENFETIYEDDDTMRVGEEVVVEQGSQGRAIAIRYLVVRNGETLHDVVFRSVYIAQNEIIRRGTKAS